MRLLPYLSAKRSDLGFAVKPLVIVLMLFYPLATIEENAAVDNLEDLWNL